MHPARLLGLLVVLWLPWGAAEAAGEAVAIRIQGEVQAERDGRSRPIERGSAVRVGDLIETGPEARARIRMPDGTVVSLGADTAFRIERFQPQRPTDGADGVFELLRGVFRAVTGTITDGPGRLEVRTRVATVGVRGTDFWGGYFFSDALDVILLEGGKVHIRNRAGEVVLSEPRDRTTVAATDQAPSAPAPIAPGQLQRAAASVAFD